MIKVYTRRIQGHQVLHYSYGTDDWSCMFHLECEVGEPWRPQAQAMARELAAKRGGVIKQVELTSAPWYVDAIVKEKP